MIQEEKQVSTDSSSSSDYTDFPDFPGQFFSGTTHPAAAVTQQRLLPLTLLLYLAAASFHRKIVK